MRGLVNAELKSRICAHLVGAFLARLGLAGAFVLAFFAGGFAQAI